MKTLEQWFEEYSTSHQNETNILIHYICVPLIYFSIVGLLAAIPSGFLSGLIPGDIPFFENWAFVVSIFVFLFYLRLSLKTAITMIIFTWLCLFINLVIAQVANLVWVSLIIFILAWLGQFYGHKIEGKKPSFIKDLQFLMIGPAWVMHKLMKK